MSYPSNFIIWELTNVIEVLVGRFYKGVVQKKVGFKGQN